MLTAYTSAQRRRAGVPPQPQARGIDPVLGRAVERLPVGPAPHRGPPEAAGEAAPARRGGRSPNAQHGNRQRHIVSGARQRTALLVLRRRKPPGIAEKRSEDHKLVAAPDEALVDERGAVLRGRRARLVNREARRVVVPDPQIRVGVRGIGRVEWHVGDEGADVAAARRDAHEPPAVAVSVVRADEEPPRRRAEGRGGAEEGRGIGRRRQGRGCGRAAREARRAAVDRPRSVARPALEEPFARAVGGAHADPRGGVAQVARAAGTAPKRVGGEGRRGFVLVGGRVGPHLHLPPRSAEEGDELEDGDGARRGRGDVCRGGHGGQLPISEAAEMRA